MRLSLFGWPAVSSHLLAVAFGMIAGGLTNDGGSSPEFYTPNLVAAPFRAKALYRVDEAKSGDKLLLVRVSKQEGGGQGDAEALRERPVCVDKETKAKLTRTEPLPVLLLSKEAAARALSLPIRVSPKAKTFYKWYPAWKTKRFVRCRDLERVQYGY